RRASSSTTSRRYLSRSATIALLRAISVSSELSCARSCATSASTGASSRKYAAATMTIAPMTPTTSFCDRGALTIGSKIGGRAMSALVPAGDLEGHQRRRPSEVPASHDQVDIFEFSRRPQIRHEVGDRRGGERGSGDLDLAAPLLECGHPEIVRDDTGEGLHQLDLLSRRLGDRLDHVDALAQPEGQVAHLALLTDLGLQRGQLPIRVVDPGGQARLGADEEQPVHADPDHQGEVHDAEEHAEIEGRQAQLDALEAGLAPAGPPGGEVDPDHYGLSPGRRSASPTATARAGPAAWTSSAYAESIWIRWNGLMSSTGMPQFDDR